MKIMMIQKSFHPNTIGIVQSLMRRGHEVIMVVHNKTEPGKKHGLLQPVRVPYNYILEKMLLRFSSETVHKYCPPRIVRLLTVFREFKPDAVILKEARLSSLVGGVIAKLFGAKPLLLTNSPPPKADSLVKKTILFLGIYPKLRICTTAGEPGALGKKWVNGARYLPYPIKLPEKNVKVLPENRKLKILFVGKWSSPRKRPWWLLEALEEAGIASEVQVTFIGRGNDTHIGAVKVQESAARIGCTEYIYMNYGVPHSEMNAMYKDHDFFVLSAKDEPDGVVVLEAMSNGLPVICSDTVGNSSCIFEGENGLIFRSESLSDLARCLKVLYDNPKELVSMGQRARETVASYCDPDKWGEAFEELVGTGSA